MAWYCECSQWQLFTNGQTSTYRTCLRDAHTTQSCRNKPVHFLVWCLQQCKPGAHTAPLLCCQPVSHHQTSLEKHHQKLPHPSSGPGPEGEQPHLLVMAGTGLHCALHCSSTTGHPSHAHRAWGECSRHFWLFLTQWQRIIPKAFYKTM